MTKMRWLHLSDYHWGDIGQSYDRAQAKDRLLEDITRMTDTHGAVDAIFFTGDLVWSGRQAEYDEAAGFLDALLRVAGDLSRERLFLVPGNHDLDRGRITSAVAALGASLVPQGRADQERVRRTVNDLLGQDVADRRRVFARLEAYFQFVKDYLDWPMDAEQYFAVRSVTVAHKKIAVVALNSAWMSPVLSGERELDQGGLLLGERQVNDALFTEAVETSDLCIALLHHPLSWLQPGDQSTSKARLYKRCDFILHGHLHEQAIEGIVTPDGQTVVIPGGACYNRTRFPNNYNLVQWDMDARTGQIHFRRYFTETGGRWAADTGLYDSAPDGAYSFDLTKVAPSARESTPRPPRHQKPAVSRLAMDVEQAYLRSLINECSNVPLSPVDPQFVTTTGLKHIPLDKVYTPLDVSGRPRRGRGATGAQACLPALQTLDTEQKPRFVLLGEPGSGKSTLVDYLTYCLSWLGLEAKDEEERRAQSGIKEELTSGGWGHLDWRPLRIVLDDMVKSGVLRDGKGTAAQVWEFLEEDIKKHVPALREAVREYQAGLFRALSDHGGLVMFDGLDEVPKLLRLRMREAIEDFAQTLPRACVLVTCRPYAYQDPAYRLGDDYRVLDLCRFGESQTVTFVERWYSMMAFMRREKPEWERRQVRSLLEALNVPALAELATRPLLLTLMACLHGAWGTLPPDRASLYEQSVELLLARWQISKGREEQQEPMQNDIALRMQDPRFRRRVRYAVAEVAYTVHVREEQFEQEGAPTSDVVEGDLLLSALDRRVDNARGVLDYIRDRAGLLLPAGDEAYTFPHRSFREYLAVCYLLDGADAERQLAGLVRRNPTWWRESFLLAVGKAALGAEGQAFRIASTLCPRERSETDLPSDSDWWAAEIAGASLAETRLPEKPDLGKDHSAVLERVRGWLVACLEEGSLTPAERAGAGDTLGRLGDPRPGVGVVDGLPDILWCEVPAGEFVMGSDAGEPEEKPQHLERTSLYYIARYSVTNAQFQTFVEAEDGYCCSANWTNAGLEWRGDRTGPDKYGGVFDLPNHPVVLVSWYEADAFCSWLNGRMKNGEWPMVDGQLAIRVWTEDGILPLSMPEGYVMRLPTQAEYEKAGRGTDGRTFPWGEDLDTDRANFDETGIGTTCPVGMFPRGRSPYGVMDIAGNAWNWCGTSWQGDYRSQADERRDLKGNAVRMVRGGGFTSYSRWLWCSYRRRHFPYLYHYDDGLRVVLAKPIG